MRLHRKMSGVFVFCLVVLPAACRSVQPVRLEENADERTRPAEIDVQLKSGAHVRVHRPMIQRDTLYGSTIVERGSGAGNAARGEAISIPLSDIAKADVSRLDAERTAVLVAVLVPVVAIGTWILLVLSSGL